MTFEDILAEIEKSEDGEEKVEVIKLRLSKPNKEAQNLRKRMKTFETKAIKYDSLVEKLEENEIDLDGDFIEQVSTLKDSKKNSSKQEKEILKLSKIVTDMQNKNIKLESSKKKSVIKEKLFKNFNEKIYNPTITLDYRIDKGEFYLNDEDELVYKHKGEEITDNIFESYTKNNPDEVKLNHKGGPGGKPFSKGSNNSGSYNEQQLKSMSVEEYNAMSPEQQKAVQESANSIA